METRDQFSYGIVTGGAFTFVHNNNPELDKCMDEGRSEASYGVRRYYPCNIVVQKKMKGGKPIYAEAAEVRGI